MPADTTLPEKTTHHGDGRAVAAARAGAGVSGLPGRDQMRAAEAREWVERVRREGHTRTTGAQRLRDILADIRKIRGAAETALLQAEIEKELKWKL